MASAVERLVNLALFLAAASGTVTAVRIREEVAGYPEGADDAAFKRMLERDKEVLRSAGLAIRSTDEGDYSLDRSATYVAPFSLSSGEAAAVRAAGVALLDDPSFPFSEDLRLALAKISAEIEGPSITATASLADEDPARQGVLVAELSSAASRCKLVTFDYTNTSGATASHTLEPYGLFLHGGRWYLVGRDTQKHEVRTYTVARIGALVVNASAPKSADFERPAGFDVAAFIRLPFQYGPESGEFVATLRLNRPASWRAAVLTGGRGDLTTDADVAVWTIAARDQQRLLRFVIENGPGIEVLGPPELLDSLRDGLRTARSHHG
ncbi:MAG TPA: WYL domain-containing protein [Coriobacteriia bacterium]|nr:WYL domain-containing protein [Coriobacteriia bacterium]